MHLTKKKKEKKKKNKKIKKNNIPWGGSSHPQMAK